MFWSFSSPGSDTAKFYQMPEHWVIPGCAHGLLKEGMLMNCVIAHSCFVIKQPGAKNSKCFWVKCPSPVEF